MARWPAELMSERLDHERPLWAFDLVGPLADGREAIVVPDPPRDGRRDQLGALPRRGALGRAAGEAPSARSRAPAAPAAAEHRRGSASSRGCRGRSARARAPREPDTVLDRRIGSRARARLRRRPARRAEGDRQASRPGHVTVNDVFLAGVAGGLRGWLAPAARRLPRLRAQIPVSLHHRDEGDDRARQPRLVLQRRPAARASRPGRGGWSGSTPRPTRRKELGDAEELYDLFHALVALQAPRPRRPSTSPARPAASSASRSPTSRVRAARSASPAGAVERLCSVAEPADRHALRDLGDLLRRQRRHRPVHRPGGGRGRRRAGRRDRRTRSCELEDAPCGC